MSYYNIIAHFHNGRAHDYSTRKRWSPLEYYSDGEGRELAYKEFSDSPLLMETLKETDKRSINMQGNISCRESVLYYLHALQPMIQGVLYDKNIGLSGFSVECLDIYSEEYVDKAVTVLSKLAKTCKVYKRNNHVCIFMADSDKHKVFSMSLMFWFYRNPVIIEELFPKLNGQMIVPDEVNTLILKNLVTESGWSNDYNNGLALSLAYYALTQGLELPADANGPANAGIRATLGHVVSYIKEFWNKNLDGFNPYVPYDSTFKDQFLNLAELVKEGRI